MAKLYAELHGDKMGGRIASKGANDTLYITITDNNKKVIELYYSEKTKTLDVHSPIDGMTLIK
jgi:hypothetical protein